MPHRTRKKTVRLLGVGFDADDGHIRITSGDKYDVLMGSDGSHDYLNRLLSGVEREIKQRGLDLDSMSPEDLQSIVQHMNG